MNDLDRLRRQGIQPTPQRLAVAACVLDSPQHPSADEVFARVQALCPTIARATVYNTLHLFVAKGLLQEHLLREGSVVFDPHVAPHHHLIDDETGEIIDIPWDAVQVAGWRTWTGTKCANTRS